MAVEVTVVAPILISQCYNPPPKSDTLGLVVAPILISQCYNVSSQFKSHPVVVAPILISQCYNYPNGKSLLCKGFPFYLF